MLRSKIKENIIKGLAVAAGVLVIVGIVIAVKSSLNNYTIDKGVNIETKKPKRVERVVDVPATSSVIRYDKEVPVSDDAFIEYTEKSSACENAGMDGFITYNPYGYYETFEAKKSGTIQAVYYDKNGYATMKIMKSVNQHPESEDDIYEERQIVEVGGILVDTGLSDGKTKVASWSKNGHNYGLVTYTEDIDRSMLNEFVQNIE